MVVFLPEGCKGMVFPAEMAAPSRVFADLRKKKDMRTHGRKRYE
jgi:hypothetical protein|nr:MAG TPA: hypothetical protein [Caudoviricetes sp.]